MYKILILLIMLVISNQAIAESPVLINDLLDAIADAENSKKDILVIFTASWCPSCMVMKKDIGNNQMILNNHIICYIDYDMNKDLVREYRVKLIPDYFILRENIEIKRRVGYDGIKKLTSWIKQNE